MGCDVARFGDDQTAIGMRQGRRFQILGNYRGLDSVQVVEPIIQFRKEYSPDAVIADGDGLGAGVVDQLLHRAATARVSSSFMAANVPAISTCISTVQQVCGLMPDLFDNGSVEIPDDPQLEVDLTEPEYGFSTKNQIQLERKEDMKRCGFASPDLGDCLAVPPSISHSAASAPHSLSITFPDQMRGWGIRTTHTCLVTHRQRVQVRDDACTQ